MAEFHLAGGQKYEVEVQPVAGQARVLRRVALSAGDDQTVEIALESP